MKLKRFLKRIPWRHKYIIIFCIGMLIVSLIYPSMESYAMAHRMSSVHGGEVLLWAVPFLNVFFVWARRYEKRRYGK